MRITPDTAILVRANVNATGPARELLQVIARTGARLVLSPFILNELARTLRYPRVQALYHLNSDEIAEHIQYLESLADLVTPAEGPRIVIQDPDDDPIVYTAVAGQADVICTTDRHFYDPNVLSFCSRRRILVMTDLQLLHALRSLD